MKTETNLYLRSLIEKQRADLLNERSCIINRISGSTMSDDEIEDATFNLSEIGQKIRKFNGFLSDLRQEGHKNELGPQPTPALSEKTVEAIRHLLEIHLKSANKMSDDIKYFLPFVPVGEERDKLVLNVKTKVGEATTALSEFNAAYPPNEEASKPKIGDKFVIISNKSPDCLHHFKIGSVVTLKYIEENGKKSYEADNGLIQIVRDRDVAPYKA